ncbi:unnamed protein product [Prunus armeniaca]
MCVINHGIFKGTPGQCRQLKTAKVTRVTNSRINIGYDKRHRVAPTPELHSSLAHDIGHVVRTHCPMQWKSWKVMPDKIKTETNYNLEDLNDESLAYVNRLFSDRYKQWKSDLHHYFEAFEDPEVALQKGYPKELEGREDTKVNKGNRKKKTLLYHSGSRPFSYRMDARLWGGPNSQRSTSLATFMFGLGMSWPSPFMAKFPTALRTIDWSTTSEWAELRFLQYERAEVAVLEDVGELEAIP